MDQVEVLQYKFSNCKSGQVQIDQQATIDMDGESTNSDFLMRESILSQLAE